MAHASELLIRSARDDEKAALDALQLRSSLEWGDYREQLLANPQVATVPVEQLPLADVAELDGRVVGFAVTLPPEAPGGDAELDGMFVEPDVWRRGVGRRLVDAAAARALAMRAAGLHVIANPRAVDFYGACGFQPAGDAQTQFGPAPAMRRAL
jgi:GNAT superfamily N-acetyltransferase